MAKEGLQFGDEGEREKEWLDEMTEAYKPLTDWLKDEPLKDVIDKAVVSNRLTDSPCALVANQYGWWVEICTLLCHNDVIPIASCFRFNHAGLGTWNGSCGHRPIPRAGRLSECVAMLVQ